MVYMPVTNIFCPVLIISLIGSMRLGAGLKNDHQSVVTWGTELLVSFNATITKLLSFNHMRDPYKLQESGTLSLLGLMLFSANKTTCTLSMMSGISKASWDAEGFLEIVMGVSCKKGDN